MKHFPIYENVERFICYTLSKKTKKGFKKKFVKGIKAFPKKKLKFP